MSTPDLAMSAVVNGNSPVRGGTIMSLRNEGEGALSGTASIFLPEALATHVLPLGTHVVLGIYRQPLGSVDQADTQPIATVAPAPMSLEEFGIPAEQLAEVGPEGEDEGDSDGDE